MEEYEIAILKVEKYNREREEQKPWESNQRKIKKILCMYMPYGYM